MASIHDDEGPRFAHWRDWPMMKAPPAPWKKSKNQRKATSESSVPRVPAIEPVPRWKRAGFRLLQKASHWSWVQIQAGFGEYGRWVFLSFLFGGSGVYACRDWIWPPAQLPALLAPPTLDGWKPEVKRTLDVRRP